MRAFLDTSALFKKYLQESGSEELERIMARVTDIAVSPVTRIEIQSILARKVRDRVLDSEESQAIQRRLWEDFKYFRHIRWTDGLVDKSCQIASQMSLRTLDSIQLASATLTFPDCFVTADRRLWQEARKILPQAHLVG